MRVIVTDSVPVESGSRTKKYYPRLVEISRARDYTTKNSVPSIADIETSTKSDLDLIKEYYKLTTNESLSEMQLAFVDECMEAED